jgi:hypothetical protein
VPCDSEDPTGTFQLDDLVKMMAGGAELENLAHELETAAETDEAAEELRRAAQVLGKEVEKPA